MRRTPMLILLASVLLSATGCHDPLDLVCTDVGIASVVAEVRDAGGHATAHGATVTILKPGTDAYGYGYGDTLRVFTDLGDLNVPGPFDVSVTKPWYTSATVRDVMPPENRCGVSGSARVSVTLTLQPDAPPVRQVVVPPYGYGYGDGNIQDSIFAAVEADAGLSHAVVWQSRDTTVVHITPDGMLTSVCRTSYGETYVVASAVADTAVRDSVAVAVDAMNPASGRCPVP
jgi:hypothetical protein